MHQKRRLKGLFGTLSLLGLSLVVASCSPSCGTGFGSGVRGNGVLKTDDRPLSSFSEIEFDTVGRVNIKIGSPSSVSISGDENLVGLVKTDVRGSRLHIGGKKNLYPKQNLVINVTTPTLTVIESEGAGAIYAADIANESLKVEQSGVGAIHLSGTTNKLTIDVSGAGSVDAEKLKAKTVDAKLSGVGSVTVDVELELKANVSGVGSITYSGDPKVESNVSGVGTIRKK